MNDTKLNNQYTINFDDDVSDLIKKLSQAYQRKPAELLRMLLKPVLINEYAKIQAIQHAENKKPWQAAIFKSDI